MRKQGRKKKAVIAKAGIFICSFYAKFVFIFDWDTTSVIK